MPSAHSRRLYALVHEFAPPLRALRRLTTSSTSVIASERQARDQRGCPPTSKIDGDLDPSHACAQLTQASTRAVRIDTVSFVRRRKQGLRPSKRNGQIDSHLLLPFGFL